MFGQLRVVCAAVALACAARGESVFARSMDRVASLDPAEASSIYAARAVRLAYETLLEYDYEARPYRLAPCLAEALPEAQSNGLVYVIRLHPEARFQPDACFGADARGLPQGRAVCAADVVFTFKRLADRKVGSPGAWLVEDAVAGMRAFAERSASAAPTDYGAAVPGLTALDARSVRFELTRPSHVFPYYLALAYGAVVPPEAVHGYGRDFGSHAVGTGPYRLARWRRNHQMDYERDVSWRGWREGPAAVTPGGLRPFDRVVYRLIDDVSTQWLCFLAGELDFLGEVTRDNWDVVIDPAGGLSQSLLTKGFTLYSMPTLEVAYIGINMDDPVLGPNRALRQALNCAFDSAAWERFYNGRVIRCDGPVPPGTAGRLETAFPYAFNLDRARQLLREAGYPDGMDPRTGRRLELSLDVGRTSQDMRETCELLASFWARVGIALKPQFHNWPTFLKRVSGRQSQMFRLGWTGDYPDAENFLKIFVSANASPGPNRANYANPAFDRLYEQACATPDEGARNRLWAEAQETLREDCPWIFLHFQKAYSLCNARVRNFRPSDFPYGDEKFLRAAP
jgi:ABC-type transport system substrate-binding protein